MRIFCKEEVRKVMKFVKHIMLMFALVVGLSVAAMAQRDDGPKRPPKNPPQVVPGKPQPRETPKPEKPKKPGAESLFILKRDGEDLA
jgi:hypothetical protein